jgi:Tfp pilus assembly protein PilP
MKKLLITLSIVIAFQACGKKSSNPPPGAAADSATSSTSNSGYTVSERKPPGALTSKTPNPSPSSTTSASTSASKAAAATSNSEASEPTVEKEEKKGVLDALKAGQLQEFYNPSGKRDPFKPFEGGEIVYSAVAKAPLERFELNQLELTAIVWGIARPKVLFRAPDGYSYIAQVGTGIGRNRGKITKITKNRVLIAEEFRDPSGQYVARESEFQMDEDPKADKLFQEMDLKYSDE